MGLNDLHNTSLVLGLGLSSSTLELKSNGPQSSQNLEKFLEPSLTLSLSGDQTHDQINQAVKSCPNNNNNKCGLFNDHEMYGQDHSPKSSSFSNVSSVKRERENIGNEEFEIDRERSRASDEDEDGSNGRKKLRLTKAQSALLEESFKIHSTLNPKEKHELARELKLRPRQVEVWFQNRRARTKLKQTEVDCEFLKKCCETLTDENRRLQKELHELKGLRLSPPLYMQLPPTAAVTMCPSCERSGGGSPENAAKSPFTMAPKSHYYNPFANPSATCM